MLGLLQIQSKTGVLSVNVGLEVISVVFDEGDIIHAWSDNSPPGTRLGNILVAQGYDAGAHTGPIGTLSLVPRALFAVARPAGHWFAAAGALVDVAVFGEPSVSCCFFEANVPSVNLDPEKDLGGLN